jgi:hypothetical protein
LKSFIQCRNNIEPEVIMIEWASANSPLHHCFTTAMDKPINYIRKLVAETETNTHQPSVLGLLLLFPYRSAAGSMPDIPSPSHRTFYCRGRCIKSGPDVEIEHWLACRLDSTRVVINHISNLFGACRSPSSHVPIMTVERWFASARSTSVLLLGADGGTPTHISPERPIPKLA